MNIKVIGTGYVGLISGLCLSLRHKVKCVDINSSIVEKINKGIPHLYEKGLSDLLKKQLQSGNFESILFNNLSLLETDIILICVGTPSLENGDCDLSYIRAAIKSLIPLLFNVKQNISIIIKSTVPPGTVENLLKKTIRKDLPKHLHPNISFGMNPEFLREGSAISDFLEPDRVVLGSECEISNEHLKKLYRHFDCPKLEVNSGTAEMIKYVNNSLLALQISAVNEYSRICENITNVDIRDVMMGVLLDKRWQSNKDHNIPPSIHNYLKAGCGFGGSCFPKDVKALSKFANSHNIKTPILDGVLSINNDQPSFIIKKIEKFIDISKAKILLLGIAFKPETDDIRDSPTHHFIKNLSLVGAEIYVHDPLVLSKLKSHPSSQYLKNSSYIENYENILPQIDVIIIITNWSCYLRLPSQVTKKNKIIFDSRGIFNSNNFPESNYLTVGLK